MDLISVVEFLRQYGGWGITVVIGYALWRGEAGGVVLGREHEALKRQLVAEKRESDAWRELVLLERGLTAEALRVLRQGFGAE